MRNKEMIEEIKNFSIASKKSNGKTLYLIKKDRTISVVFQFIGDIFCQYMDYGISSFFWRMESIEYFYEKYIKHINDFLEYKEYSKRFYGESKLEKPSELKGIKPILSIKFPVRKAQIYVKNNDVWIKDNDYFSTCISQEEAIQLGLKFKLRQKFVYNDNFTCIVLLNQGWICIKNLLLYLEDENIAERLQNEICNFYNWSVSDFSGDFERFYKDLIYKLKTLYI